MSGANNATGVGKGSGEYGTPDYFYGQMDRRYQFDYDAFASHLNAKTPLYSTRDGTFKTNAALSRAGIDREQISDLSGLAYPWRNRRVFCNPPYSRGEITECVKKMAAEALLPVDRAPQVIAALLPAATDTDWFQQWVLPHANIIWLPRRIHFIHPPFECGPKCQVPKKDGSVHALDAPLDNPPGAYCIAEYRTKWNV